MQTLHGIMEAWLTDFMTLSWWWFVLQTVKASSGQNVVLSSNQIKSFI